MNDLLTKEKRKSIKFGLEKIFSEENLTSYSKACVDMALDMGGVYKSKEFDTLVIPSRGAVPLFLGTMHALKKFGSLDESHRNLYRNLGIQEMLAPLFPTGSVLPTKVQEKDVRVLLIPFTADLNIPRFDPTQNNDDHTARTRNYWANVTASFFKNPEERKNDPYFRTFAEILLSDIENRGGLAKGYTSFPTIKRFAMMDTVISGRASNDILPAFDRLSENYKNPNLQPYSFLIVDESGEKLKRHRRFDRYLREKESYDKSKKYLVSRIVSEDENSSLLGVAATVYPSIMRESYGLEVKDDDGQKRDFYIGAGTWHIIREGDSMDNFHRFMDVIYKGIDSVYSHEWEVLESEDPREVFEEARNEYIDFAVNNNVLGLKDGAYIPQGLNARYSLGDIYETSSSVVHVPLQQSSTQNIINKVLSYEQVFKKKKVQEHKP